MITPTEYLNKKLPIIPCKEKKPIVAEWQRKDFKIEDFKPGDNMGLKLKDFTDIDIDNPKALPFINKYIQPCSALFGREKQMPMHQLFKGQNKHKKFALHDDLEKYFKNNIHGATIIECRSGEDKQTIVPGSVIGGEKIEWKVFEGISPYPGNLFKDISKVAFATALSILYPKTGNRDDYVYAIACILARHTKWKDWEIDEFILHLAEYSGDEEARKNKGTHAYKQMANGGRLMGFNTIKELLGLSDAQSIFNIFQWVGVNPPNRALEELKKRIIFIEDSSSLFDVITGIEKKKDDFNNSKLFHFPGGKEKKKAFESLMDDYEFQERIVQGRAVLPGYDYPIAEIGKDHFHLKPGKYLNLYPGSPIKPERGDVSDWVNSYKRILGKENYEYIEQYIGAFIQKVFKYLLDLPEDKLKEIGPMKIQWGLLLVGPEGTGKKALAHTLQRIVGKEFVDGNARYDEIIGSHSEVIYNKLFIFINEVVTTGQIDKKVEISNKLKPFWTDEDCKINPKHIRPFRYWNNANGMCLSNEEDCLYIGKTSRRYAVINLYDCLSVAKLEAFEKDGTFKKIYDFIHSDKVKHLFHYFLKEVKIKDWRLFNQGRAPKTPALKVMQEDSVHPIVKRLNRALDERLPPFDDRFPGFCTLDEILNFIKSKWQVNINEKYIKDWLREVGHKWKNGKLTRQILIPSNGSRPRIHKLIDNEHLDEKSETELGSAPNFTRWEWRDHNFDRALKLEETGSTYNENQSIKISIIKSFLKRSFGPQWYSNEYEHFIEAILLGIYRTKKKYKHIIDQNTSGSRELPQRDWGKIMEAKRKIASEVREIVMEETQKVYEDITPKPSDKLWDKDEK